MPMVSVVVPTRNRATLLPRAVESAFAAGTDVEVIVVDDASTDDTAAVCGRLAAIRYVRLEISQGPAGARNAGIRASSAEFISFLDDDDVRLPGSLDYQVSSLEQEPRAAFCYGRVRFASTKGRGWVAHRPRKLHRGDVFWELLAYNFLFIPSAVVRRQRLLEVGPFDLDLTGVEDWDLWIRLAERSPVLVVDEPVAIYRLADPESGQISSDGVRMAAVSERAREKAFRLPRVVNAPLEEPAALERLRRNLRTDKLIWSAAAALGKRKVRLAREQLMEALRMNPWRAARLWTFKLLLSSIVRSAEG